MSTHNVIDEINASPDEVVNFKVTGIQADVIAESTAATGVTIDGVKLKDSEVYTDVVHEKTATVGVTVDNVLLKDAEVTAIALRMSTDGLIYPDNGTATGTVDGAAIATLDKMAGVITTATQTTAAGAQTTLTLTNSQVAAADIVLAAVSTTGTGTPVVAEITPAAGSVVIVIQNIHASAAFNAALKVYFIVFTA